MHFDAILWDCDGCLIDSEYIACSLSAEMLTAAGYPISVGDYITRFCGQHKDHIFSTIHDETGVDYSNLFEKGDKKQKQRDAFEKSLKAIDGIYDVLDAINLPMAIASGSDYERLTLTLDITGLHHRFRGKIFSASLVPRGKPYPDIFLYAAEQLKIAPARCLVIEDSINGVRAGKAAGMTVFGFTGGSHIFDKAAHRQTLLDLGTDYVFDAMRDLPGLMEKSGFQHRQGWGKGAGRPIP